jgi:phage FluMu protein gp41
MERQMLHLTARRRIGTVSAVHHAQGPLNLRDLGRLYEGDLRIVVELEKAMPSSLDSVSTRSTRLHPPPNARSPDVA